MRIEAVLAGAVDEERLAQVDLDHGEKDGVEVEAAAVRPAVVAETCQEDEAGQPEGEEVQQRPDPAPAAEVPPQGGECGRQQRQGQQRVHEEEVSPEVEVFVAQQSKPDDDGQPRGEGDPTTPAENGRRRESFLPAPAEEGEHEQRRGQERDAGQVGQSFARLRVAVFGHDEALGDDGPLRRRHSHGRMQPEGQRQEQQDRRRDAAGSLDHFSSASIRTAISIGAATVRERF